MRPSMPIASTPNAKTPLEAAPRPDVQSLAAALQRRLEVLEGSTYDPYDGLTSPLFVGLRRRPLWGRVGMQLVKRAPCNLRPFLGIQPALYSKTLSDMSSAAFRFYRTRRESSHLQDGLRHLAVLRQRLLPAVPGSAWGMELPYVSRFVVASPQTPNLFQSVNACNAFLDAHEITGDQEHLDVAIGVVEFLEQALGRLEDTPERISWRYYPQLDTVVHNVNALIAALLLRLGSAAARPDVATLGERTLRSVLAAQNPDGSWYYARVPQGRWVDGFHSGYVLESLVDAEGRLNAAPDLQAATREALERGLRFFVEHLLDEDGTPRYQVTSLYPIEVQNCAQAVQLLARLALTERENWLQRARGALAATCRHLLVERPGTPRQVSFGLQRGRWLRTNLEAARWGLAPMLLALAWLDAAEQAAIGREKA